MKQSKFLIIFLLTFNLWAALDRSSVGPVYNAPIEFEGKLYLLATTGVLYKSDYKLDEYKVLFQTKKSSVSGLTLNGSVLYFGEGLHDDITSNFYAYDLKQEKLLFEIPVKGHIERAPLIVDDVGYLNIGPGGFVAVNLTTKKTVWELTKIDNQPLHVDTTSIAYKNSICFTSIYKYKAFVCVNKKSGKKDFAISLNKSPKSQLNIVKNKVFGLSSEADMVTPKWQTPGNFYVIDLDKKKKIVDLELRGYSFYQPQIYSESDAIVTLSTGDVILINIENGKISYVDELKQPITANAFKKGDHICVTSIAGLLRCYTKGSDKFEIKSENNLVENIIGEIVTINNKTYLPTRTSFKLF